MKREFSRAASTYAAAAVLARETGCRMAERLDYTRLSPTRIADIGCATGDGILDLQQRYPAALPLAVDLALPMLVQVRSRIPLMQRIVRRAPRLINADAQALPLAANSLNLVWSNLMLHWLDDPLPALRELHRILAVDGLLMFSMLGPDTLKELRTACLACGITPPLRKFLDMHDIGDMLGVAGFADPVMDMEMITLSYSNPRGLLRDQRHLGVREALLGYLPWRDWRRVLRVWTGQRGDQGWPASFEIVYGQAWKPAPRLIDDGRAIVHVQRRSA